MEQITLSCSFDFYSQKGFVFLTILPPTKKSLIPINLLKEMSHNMDVQIADGIDERPLPFSCFGLFGLTIYERKVI